ncbi:hypothetical protein SM124_17890 [Bacillus sp. 31A1R]|uniref:Uncharacterized protein n=1 Tax=Robertmurraya mangrovi TaxID=3098077 RepID=A0ABU5J2K4_9BACI|nr:hypothetical protein [Bacillus sp. 31A1R]MDZ5473591.1 hypothetical protein [Bacillus sp. 31A1R]
MLKRLGFTFLGLIIMCSLIMGAASATGVTYDPPSLTENTSPQTTDKQYAGKVQKQLESFGTLITGLLTFK